METTGTSAFSALADKDVFMDLLLAQLQNQNPDDPVSNSEIVAQMAQLATVEGIKQMNASFSAVLKLERLLSGSELVGRELEYVQDGITQRGVVESVAFDDGTIQFTVNGSEIPLEDMTRVF